MLEKLYYSNSDVASGAWDDITFWLYVFILLSVWFLGYFAQSTYKNPPNIVLRKYYRFFLIVALLILFVFQAFRGANVGKDTISYINIYSDSISSGNRTYYKIEPFFFVINTFFHFFLPDGRWSIILFSGLTLLFLFKTIDSNNKSIDIAMALFFYVAIGYYLKSFNLLRIIFAVSIELYFFKYLLSGKWLKYMLVIILCCLIHYSSIITIFTVAAYWLYCKNKWAFVFVLALVIFMIPFLKDNFALFLFAARYEDYLSTEMGAGGLGLLQIVYHLPLFVFAFYMKGKCENKYIDLLIVYSVISFFIGYMSYYLPIGRLGNHFIPIFIILIPHCLLMLKNKKVQYSGVFYSMFYVYGLLRFHMYLTEYLAADGLMPYSFMKY